MGYRIKFKKGSERISLSADTPKEVLSLAETKQGEGYEVVQMLDADGNEADLHHLEVNLGGGVTVRSV